MDDDVPGQEGANKCAQKLGAGRCLLVPGAISGGKAVKDARTGPRKVTWAQRRARKRPATLQSDPETLECRPKSIDLDLKQPKARIHENITIYVVFHKF